VDVIVQNKERPLHIAARHGHVKMVEALLTDEASPQLKSVVSISYIDIYTAVISEICFLLQVTVRSRGA